MNGKQKVVVFTTLALCCSSTFGVQAEDEFSLQQTAPILLTKLPSAEEPTRRRFAVEYRPILSLSTHTRVSDSSASGLSLFSTQLGWESAPDIQYATFRTEGAFYWKGRAGYAWNEELSDWADFKNIFSKFDVNGALGLGAGYQLSNGQRFEIEYTTKSNDFSVLNMGLTF